MPKKLPESLREKVVQLRREGRTYTEIEAMVVNPDTGQPLARPTTIQILREAGLTRRAAAGAATARPPSGATPSTKSSTPAPTVSTPPRVSRGNGVDEFMPKAKPAPKKAGPVEVECENCGSEFTADSEADVPDECPECGN